MQVERNKWLASLFSGGRVSNTWVTYLDLWNNGWKRPLIPDVVDRGNLIH